MHCPIIKHKVALEIPYNPVLPLYRGMNRWRWKFMDCAPGGPAHAGIVVTSTTLRTSLDDKHACPPDPEAPGQAG